jgi:hypothetical protein
VTQYITMIVMLLPTPKVGAKHELALNKPAYVLDFCAERAEMWIC